MRLLFGLIAFSLVLSACAKKDDVIVRTGEGKEVGAPQIDSDPLALLPGNAIGIVSVDATKLFASQFGAKLLGIARQQAPVPASAGYEPSRDLKHLYVGFYSMSGADVVGVAIGTFDRAKIEAASDGVQQTPQGVPVIKSTYAGRTLFTAGNMGFCVLTQQTTLFGNDTGIRRALDRIREGRVRRQVPRWMDKLLTQQKAPLIGGADLKSQPLPNAARENLAFLNGVETLSAIGNFENPGLNIAGTLVYADEANAVRGAEDVRNLEQKLKSYSTLMALFGIPQPVRKLQAQAKGKEAAFVLGVDAAAVSVLLDKAQELLGVYASRNAASAGSPGSVSQ
jgi:hypothetical protein